MLKAHDAWKQLQEYKDRYYDENAAAYSGDRKLLRATAIPDSFWARTQNCKMHVPIASDIASTSSDLLFGETPRFELFNHKEKEEDKKSIDRFEELISLNELSSLLSEACETCSALGDVFLKINWSKEDFDYPTLSVVQPDSAWAEYVFGSLKCIHIFSVILLEEEKVTRIYERYSKGLIEVSLFEGTSTKLGHEILDDYLLEQIGLKRVIETPINELLAVHIPNIRPNRKFRNSKLGRSDFDSLRDLGDSLDEAYTSWLRDIRLAKARTIVPVEYLRKVPIGADDGLSSSGYFDFDQDVETFCTMDIDTDKLSNPITLSQFEIRASQHKDSCLNFIERIISSAGYSPQSFGLHIEGTSASGTALKIREKKSYATVMKKQSYWKNPLEKLLGALVHLDSVLYPSFGSKADSSVVVNFRDGWLDDISTISTAVEQISRADAASLETKVKMLHPYWNEYQVNAEIEKINAENGLDVENPSVNAMLGDYEE